MHAGGSSACWECMPVAHRHVGNVPNCGQAMNGQSTQKFEPNGAERIMEHAAPNRSRTVQKGNHRSSPSRGHIWACPQVNVQNQHFPVFSDHFDCSSGLN
eukprot:gene25849-biopygen10551